MTYYAFIENDKINGTGQCPILNDEIANFEITEEVYNNIDHYIWDGSDVVLNPNYDAEQLAKAKQAKYDEANHGAADYIASGNALFEFDTDKHIEATDGNIGKFSAYALGYVTGQLQPEDTVVWNTKEDETVLLTADQVSAILSGLGQVQAEVWAVKFPYYLQLLEAATTVEEVNAIEIDYSQEIPEVESEG